MAEYDRPNIVWVTIDSLRYDHTSLADRGPDTTPNIERLAESDGTRSFRHGITHGIDTATSTASIMTGTFPSYHGVNIGEGTGTIPQDLATIPERLSDVGYRTVCLTRNPRLELVGADRGFDRFEQLSYSTLLQPDMWSKTLRWGARIRRHSAGLTSEKMRHSLASVMSDIATDWLDDLAEREPFFFYCHFNEPHRPYTPPVPYMKRYAADLSVSAEEAVDIATDIHENAYEYVANGLDLTDTQWSALTAMYDAAIAYTDDRIGVVLDRLGSLDLGDTVIVVTADHGELLGEGGFLAHQFLVHDALVNVPLIVHGLDSIAELSVNDDNLVQHGDILHTLLGVAGASTDGLQTVDLRNSGREIAFSQADPNFDHILAQNSEFSLSDHHTSLTTGIRTQDYKLVTSDDKTELFELPDEEADVSDSRPDIREKLVDGYEEFTEIVGNSSYLNDVTDDYEESVKRRLEEMGYITR